MNKKENSFPVYGFCTYFRYRLNVTVTVVDVLYSFEIDDYYNKKQVSRFQVTYDCQRFIDYIYSLLNNPLFSEFSYSRDRLVIDYFDPDSGSTKLYNIKITELRN